MSLLQRLKRPPEGAHFQRTVDGGFGTIWLCSEGHGSVGEPESPPKQCMECAFGRGPEPSKFRRATKAEAFRFIVRLEGFSGATSGVGFRMLP